MGCIGALDGWVVKVKKPSLWDGVQDPASFYSSNGYFGINVQAIVDRFLTFIYLSKVSFSKIGITLLI